MINNNNKTQNFKHKFLNFLKRQFDYQVNFKVTKLLKLFKLILILKYTYSL